MTRWIGWLINILLCVGCNMQTQYFVCLTATGFYLLGFPSEKIYRDFRLNVSSEFSFSYSEKKNKNEYVSMRLQKLSGLNCLMILLLCCVAWKRFRQNILKLTL